MKYTLEGCETQRLRFRLLKENDFDEWVELFRDLETAKFLGMDKIETPEKRCDKWFELTFIRYNNNQGGQNILIDKLSNKIIGQSGLLEREFDDKKVLEVAYSILPNYRRKGYASEAAIKCRDIAFENNYSEKLISIINIENIASEKVAINNGMKKDRTIEFYGNMVNIYQITHDEWMAL